MQRNWDTIGGFARTAAQFKTLAHALYEPATPEDKIYKARGWLKLLRMLPSYHHDDATNTSLRRSQRSSSIRRNIGRSRTTEAGKSLKSSWPGSRVSWACVARRSTWPISGARLIPKVPTSLSPSTSTMHSTGLPTVINGLDSSSPSLKSTRRKWASLPFSIPKSGSSCEFHRSLVYVRSWQTSNLVQGATLGR